MINTDYAPLPQYADVGGLFVTIVAGVIWETSPHLVQDRRDIKQRAYCTHACKSSEKGIRLARLDTLLPHSILDTLHHEYSVTVTAS